jgi:hypothetical protein
MFGVPRLRGGDLLGAAECPKAELRTRLNLHMGSFFLGCPLTSVLRLLIMPCGH